MRALLLFFAPALLAGPPQEIAAKALAEARAGRHAQALLLYQKALDMRPESPEAIYNFATALYRTEDYERALDHFGRAAQLARRGKFAARARYNAGNSAFYLGLGLTAKDPRGALALMERALDCFGEALRLDANLRDAAHNAEVAKKWLRLLEEHFARMQEGPAAPAPGPANALEAILGQERQRPMGGIRAAPHKVDKDW